MKNKTTLLILLTLSAVMTIGFAQEKNNFIEANEAEMSMSFRELPLLTKPYICRRAKAFQAEQKCNYKHLSRDF